MKKSEFIKKYNGQEFKRIVTKGLTVEDIPQVKSDLEAAAAEQGLTIKENGGMWDIVDEKGQETGQRFFIPKMLREQVGTLHFRSKDTVFSVDGQNVYGDYPKAADFDEHGFTVDYGTIAYRYELV